MTLYLIPMDVEEMNVNVFPDFRKRVGSSHASLTETLPEYKTKGRIVLFSLSPFFYLLHHPAPPPQRHKTHDSVSFHESTQVFIGHLFKNSGTYINLSFIGELRMICVDSNPIQVGMMTRFLGGWGHLGLVFPSPSLTSSWLTSIQAEKPFHFSHSHPRCCCSFFPFPISGDSSGSILQ